MILLDTDTCIGLLRQRPPSARQRLLQAVEQGRRPSISVITLFELQHGALRSVAKDKALSEVAALTQLYELAQFDDLDAQRAAGIEADLRARGQRIGAYDTLIAGQALARDLTLVTGNTREFERVPGLRLENWLI